MRIFCFGDSNTYGYDPRGYFGGRYAAADRWPDLLASQTQWEVLNAGLNGRTIPRSADVPELAGLGNGDLLLVMLGTNDLLQGNSAKEAAAAMEAFLKPLLPHCAQLLLVAPPPLQRGAWVPTDALVAESRQLAREYQTLARKLGIPFADTGEWNVALAYDGVHFTEAGHHTFAEKLGEILRR